MVPGSQLSEARCNGVNNCKDILVGQVLPRNQKLILEELYEKEEYWCVQSQLESLEAEACTCIVCLRICAVVFKASLLIA